MEAVFLIGRILFAAMFINSGIAHLTKLAPMSQYAASQKGPAPKLAVAFSGLMILAGGLSILLGVAPQAGAPLLILFLIPTAFLMHRFWGVQAQMLAANQMAHFMKNVTLAGGALLIYYFTALHPEAWGLSLGRRRAARSQPLPRREQLARP